MLGPGGKQALADALLALAQETFANRSRLLPEEPPPVRLTAPEPGAPFEPQAIGTGAPKELRQQMREADMPEPTHYYTTRERAEVGEIDRTYTLGRPPRSRRSTPR